MKNQLFSFLFLISFAFSISAQTQEARKINEFNFEHCEVWKLNLDMLANELFNTPNTKAYIIYYGGKSYPSYKNERIINKLSRRGEADAIVEYYKNDLFAKDIKLKERVISLDAGYQEKFKVEFWIIPEGAELPKLNPTINPKFIKFRKGKVSKKELDARCNF
jgi:hypothetical protein